MDSEQELRRSGRSTRRASLTGNGGFDETESPEDELVENGSAKKAQRRSSSESLIPQKRISIGASGMDESKHSFKFDMTKETFLKDLYSFMQARGQPISKLPSLGYKELDLYLLYQLVIARGGMDDVTSKQEWKLVYQDLGIPTMSTSASYNTRTNYKKYLYLYELEHCDFPDKNRPKDAKPMYQIGEFIRIVSSVFEGQVFFARILKYRYRDGKNQYYVHYNGWSSSHDEWMREDVLDILNEDEKAAPELLSNPAPSRSSKSNHLIYDPTVSEKIINNLVSGQQQKPSKLIQNPLSPSSPASLKKPKRNVAESTLFGGSSEEEEAANELILGMERCSKSTRQICSMNNGYIPKINSVYRQPVEVLRYPMRLDPGDSISKIFEEKRHRPHEQDLIHCNRLHTHILMGNGFAESAKERNLVAEFLGSVKIRIEVGNEQDLDSDLIDLIKEDKKPSRRSQNPTKSTEPADPRSLKDIQESLVSLQASLLSTQTSYKHALKALKKHHNIQTLPAQPKKTFISARK